jgi:hypothetical protein
MNTKPAYVADGRGSDGFVEIADRILSAREETAIERHRQKD